MTAAKCTNAATVVTKIAVGSNELRIQLYTSPAAVDLRWFAPGGGPAAVQMPKKTGLTFPLEDVAEVIEALKSAELVGRSNLLRGAK